MITFLYYYTDTGLHEYSYWSTVANRLLYSSVYTSIYVTAFVIQSIIFIATCIHVADLATIHFRTWFILLDVFVTLLLAAEVAVRVLAMREKFWHSWLNIVDLCVLGLCSILFFCWIFNDGAVVAGEFLLSVRYGVQLVRMVMMMKEHQRRITIVSSIEKSVDLSAWDTDQLPPLSAVRRYVALLMNHTLGSLTIYITMTTDAYTLQPRLSISFGTITDATYHAHICQHIIGKEGRRSP